MQAPNFDPLYSKMRLKPIPKIKKKTFDPTIEFARENLDKLRDRA